MKNGNLRCAKMVEKCVGRGAESVVLSEGASTLPTAWCPLAGADYPPSRGGWGCWRKMLLWASPQGACHDFPLVFVLGEMKVPVPPAAAADAFSAASPRLAPMGCQLLHKQAQLKTSPGSGPGICCDQPQTAAGKARLEPRGRRIFEAEASKPPGLGGNAWCSPSLEGEEIQSHHPKMKSSNEFNAGLKTN